VAGWLLAKGRITPGELLAASQYVLMAASLGSVVDAVSRLARARAAAARLVEVFLQPRMRYGSAQLPAGGGRLELRGIRMRSTFDGLSVVVPAGALVAVVGRSGAGKSPLRELEHGELRRAVGYGFERPALFGETVADAIAFGAEAPPAARVVAAARGARADEFIRRLPDAYSTPLERAPMSGGEAQRIGLARTFAHAGRMVVLDDVAASLDTVTEHHISRVLTEGLADRTRLIVAHRASTAALVDVVIWLDDGRVRAMASHRELWRDGEYRALFGAAA
jgi:ATP-binding cassette subfamily B protein